MVQTSPLLYLAKKPSVDLCKNVPLLILLHYFVLFSSNFIIFLGWQFTVTHNDSLHRYGVLVASYKAESRVLSKRSVASLHETAKAYVLANKFAVHRLFHFTPLCTEIMCHQCAKTTLPTSETLVNKGFSQEYTASVQRDERALQQRLMLSDALHSFR